MAGYGGKTFDPIKFDGNAPPAPDVTDGCYKLRCTDIEIKSYEPPPEANDPHIYPQLMMTWEVVENLEPRDSPRFKAAEGSIGGEIVDRLTFRPEEQRGKGRMAKQRYRELCDLANANYRIIPLEIRGESDFNEFITLLTNQEFTGWVKNEPDRRDKDRSWARLYFTEPKSMGAGDMGPEPESTEPVETEAVELDPDAEPESAETADAGTDLEPEEEPAPEPPPAAAKKTAAPARPVANGAKAPAAPARPAAPTAAATRPGTRPAAPATRPAARR
jgi:hypothetical protein